MCIAAANRTTNDHLLLSRLAVYEPRSLGSESSTDKNPARPAIKRSTLSKTPQIKL